MMEGTRIAYFALAFIYIVWGAIFWILSEIGTFGGTKTLLGKDYLHHLIGVALVFDGIVLAIGAGGWTMTLSQLKDRLVVSRWISWGVSHSLFFVVFACAVCTTAAEVWFLALIGITGIGLAFAQSTNEALHCGPYETDNDQKGLTGYRTEGYLVATVLFVFLFVMYIVVGIDHGIEGWLFSLVLVPTIVYLLLHLFYILPAATNFSWFGNLKDTKNYGTREAWFLAAQFIINLYVSIAAAAKPGDIGPGDCP